MNDYKRGSIGLETWAARNLCFLSVIQLPLSFLSLFVLGAALDIMALPYYPQLPAKRVFFCVSETALIIFGVVMLIQYWRYPRLMFRMPLSLFWLCSALFIPSCVTLAVFLIWGGLPQWSELKDYSAFLFAGALLPLGHFVLSIVGAFAYFRRYRARSKGQVEITRGL